MSTPTRNSLPPVPKLRDQAATATFSQPPLDGSLSTAEIYEWHAQYSPHHPAFQYLDDDKTIKTITFSDALQAIYRGGWLLRAAMEKVPQATGKRPVIAVVALSGTNSFHRK